MDALIPPASNRLSVLFSVILVFTLSGIAMAQGRASYLPNPKLTPGATLNVTKDDVCDSATDLAHNIPVVLKRQVFDRYSIRPNAAGGYDVDRLIPTGLGGSNAIKNLWPQPFTGEWNHDLKNRLEHRLHKMVCGGALDLKIAQQEIADDWVSAYRKYLGEPGNERTRRHKSRRTLKSR